MNEMTLEHHGILGQKWGVRRFQNADGSLTEAGRKRYGTGEARETSKNSMSESTKSALKTAGKAALIAGSVAAAGYLYSQNADEINDLVKEAGFWSYQYAKAYAKTGKAYVGKMAKESLKQAQAGAKEAIKETPKNLGKAAVGGVEKVAKGAVEGAAIIAAKKFMESVLGEEAVKQSTQAYNAYNKKKKIGQINSPNRNEDDDDE